MRNTLYDLVIFVLIVMCVGVYVMYRFAAAFSLSNIESLTELRSAPATTCTVSQGNFEGSSTGTLAVYDGNALFNVEVKGTVKDFSGPLHVLIRGDGAHYIFPETSRVLPITASSAQRVQIIDALIFSYEWSCAPWWIPESSVFAIPDPKGA